MFYVQCKNTEEVAIDWVDEAVCHQGLIKLFISLLYFRQEIPNPFNSVQRHIPMHLGIASPSHTHVHRTLPKFTPCSRQCAV